MDLKRFVLKHIAPATETARDAWVIKHILKLPRGESILDVGAGEMPYRKYCNHLKYKSHDFGKYSGVNVKVGIKSGKYDTKHVDIVSDITHIPVRKNSFDYVLCTEVLEHIPEPIDALEEIARIDRKGLIITAPFASLTHFYPYFFYKGFSEQFYRVNLPKFGYKIKELFTYGNYFDLLGLELLRLPLMIIEYRKPLLPVGILVLLPAVPLYFFIRLLSRLFSQSSSVFCFGICVFARKI